MLSFSQRLPFTSLLITLFLIGGASSFLVPQLSSRSDIWTDDSEFQIQAMPEKRLIIPDTYRTVAADVAQLQARLALAPLESMGQAQAVELLLPLPNGESGRFAIVESPVMAPALAAKFPTIRTYSGQGIDDPSATVRLDWTPHGFHAMILSINGAVYIDPYGQGNTSHYISYYKSDFTPTETPQEYGPVQLDQTAENLAQQLAANQGTFSTGPQLRTYRLAVAATGEYTVFHGGTVEDGQAAIVTAINRITGIYEREAAVRLILVANNDAVVFTDSGTDPYSNNNGFAMLDQNQATLNSIIGSGNYDVGHVFSTGGGGVAGLGVVCSGRKGEGVTGLSSPTGDPFYIDYVSHELGHQFGATHTFNSTAGFCSGNLTHISAYEPGSGTTIMGYAGICSSDNIQFNSDAYFHTMNFDQIQNHVMVGSGSGCGTVTATGNLAPVAAAGSGGFTIPAHTPFTLTGSGSDGNGDPLTFNWEQFDLGPSGSPNSPTGNAPLFRSFPPTSTPSRTFPQLSDLLNNTHTLGEILPTYSRSLVFRLTARDNRNGGGGVSHDQISLNVTAAAGPFKVTAPNTAVVWNFGDSETVTWNVANTNQAPINCANVDILLSFDGGLTYAITLLAATPNDGSETIPVPNAALNNARLKVACSNNIFFDISDSDFSITTASTQAPTAISVTGPTAGMGLVPYTFSAVASPNDAIIPLTYDWTVTDLAGTTQQNLYSDSATFSWGSTGVKMVQVTVSNSAGSITSAPYVISLEGAIINLPLVQE